MRSSGHGHSSTSPGACTCTAYSSSRQNPACSRRAAAQRVQLELERQRQLARHPPPAPRTTRTPVPGALFYGRLPAADVAAELAAVGSGPATAEDGVDILDEAAEYDDARDGDAALDINAELRELDAESERLAQQQRDAEADY